MTKLKGLPKLNKAIEKLKEVAEEIRENLDEKRDWLENKSDKFQESDAGEAWSNYLYEVECLLDNIENLEILGDD